MLPFLNLPGSLLEILSAFRPCFTAPGFATFCGLVAGVAGQPRRRTVTGMLLGAGLARRWPHDRAHRFFARARWDPDELGLAVARLAALLLVPPGAGLRVAVDDSVFRRSGRKVFGAGWQHDGSAPSRDKVSYGCCFVVAALLVHLPFCSREVALPVLARLRLPGRYRGVRRRAPRSELGPGTVEIAAALITRLASAFPGRAVHVVADGAYHGPALRALPPAVTWTCRIPRNAVLYAPPPPPTGRRGRPRTKGALLGAPRDIAAAAPWRTVAAVTYHGRTDTVRLADIPCVWYGSWRARPVRLILARRPGAAGYDLALVTTDLTAAPAALLTRYAARWAIEQAFADARAVLGAGEARNRTPRAVQRTVPFTLLASTITVIWYARAGHDPAAVTDRRRDQPWYTAKTEPAFEDMLTSLRRALITARISGGHPAPPTTSQIQAVLTAWAAAAA
jgi:DDE superfamily endonuclease